MTIPSPEFTLLAVQESVLMGPENNNEPFASSALDTPRTEVDVVMKSPSLLDNEKAALSVKVVFAS